MESELNVNTKGKIPSTGKNSPQMRMEPTTLHPAGQRAKQTTNGKQDSILGLLFLRRMPYHQANKIVGAPETQVQILSQVQKMFIFSQLTLLARVSISFKWS